MFTSCNNCKKLFQGDECKCGWVKPNKKEIVNGPKFDPSYEKRYHERLEKRTGMREIKKNAPKLEKGDSKEAISEFWLEKIKKRIKNPNSEWVLMA